MTLCSKKGKGRYSS